MAQEQARDFGRARVGATAADTTPRKGEKVVEMSVLGPDILVTGNIEATVDLLIEGRIVGDVKCMTLVLGTGSSVVGSITADRVRVSGTVEGAINTKDLAIEAGANVQGEISYSRIRIANGGVIQGQLKHVPLAEEDEAQEPETKLKLVEPVAAADENGEAKVYSYE